MLDQQAANIAHTVLVGLIFLTGLCLCCLSFCFTRKKGDKERVGFVYVKVAWPLFQLYCLFDVAASIFALISNELGSSGDYVPDGFVEIQSQLSNTVNFLGDLANVFVFLAIARLGAGVLRARDETAAPPRWPRIVGWTAYAAGALIGILTLSLWAYGISYIRNIFDDDGLGFSDTTEAVAVSLRLGFAIIVLFFVLALLTLCWTTAVLILTLAARPKESRRLTKPAIYLLVISVLWLAVRVYALAEFADQIDTSSSSFYYKGTRTYLAITSAIFSFGGLWLLLIVLVALGRVPDYSGGLWSAAINAPYWRPGPHLQPPMAGGFLDPSKTMGTYGYPPNTLYGIGYQAAPQQGQPPHTALAGHQHQQPSPPSQIATPAVDASTPRMDTATPASPMPPSVPGPAGRTELPLTHPPTEWELPVESAVSEGAPASPKPGPATAGPSTQ